MLSPPGSKNRLFYGWVVVAVCFALNAIVFGTRYSFGVFFKSIEAEFNLNRAATSSIFSTYMLLCPIFAVLCGWALDKYGPRVVTLLMSFFTGLSLVLTSQTNSAWQLFITYSLLMAIGTGAVFTVIMATVARWFDKQRGLAMGISSSGVGVGTVLMAPFATYLISSFDWSMAFIVIGLMAGLFMASLAVLLKKDPIEIGLLPDGVKPDSGDVSVPERSHRAIPASFSLTQALRTRSFWLLLIAWLSFSLCLHLILTHIVPHATDVAISAGDAALVLGFIGIFSIPGRLIVGWISDRASRRVSAVICALFLTGAMLWLVWSQGLWMFYVFALLFGFTYGGFDVPVIALMGDIFGVRNIGVILGALVFGWGTGAAIGPAIGGLVFDATDSYAIAFLIGALLMLVAGLCVVLTRRETVGSSGHGP